MNIFDEELVIVVESANAAGVYSVNGRAGYVTLTDSDFNFTGIVNVTGDQTITGQKDFLTRPTVSGIDVLLKSEGSTPILPDNLIYNTGANFLDRPTVNGTGFLLSGEVVPVDISGYYTSDNPSGFITGVDLSNYVTTSGGQFRDRPTVNGTGILLSGDVVQSAAILSFTAPVLTGVDFQTIAFPSPLLTTPNSVCITMENCQDSIYGAFISDKTSSGISVYFSDDIAETGVYINVIAY